MIFISQHQRNSDQIATTKEIESLGIHYNSFICENFDLNISLHSFKF